MMCGTMLLFVSMLCVLATVRSTPEKLKPIVLPALGRQFTLGVLYDRRREEILEGPKLWSEDELRNYDTQPSYSTHFQIVASSDIREDMNHFDLSASMKMSFLAGAIDVAGSAGYLQDRKTKNNVARVSLGYRSSTFKRTLAPEMFLKVTYPEVLKQAPDATDVVAAIQYGAGAIFTFDREVHGNEKMRDIQGRLALSVKKLPSFSVNGTGDVNITEIERKEMEQFSCHFHGDFILKKHPGTYEEAIIVYKELPGLLGKNYENSVPVKIWLYPVEDLPVDRADQIVYDINESLVTSVTDVISELEGLIRECNDILFSSKVSLRHSRIREKVSTFKQYLQRYMLNFKQQITKILPKVRKGTLPIDELKKLVTKKESSPFSKQKLEDWLSYYVEEVKVLSKIQSLPNYCRNDGDFSSKLLNDVRYTVGLTLQLGTMEDRFLKSLEHYLSSQAAKYEDRNHGTPSKWFSPGSEVLSDLYMLSTTFNDFYERTKEKEPYASSDIQFLVREKVMEDNYEKSVTIEFYDRAVLKERNYQLTSPPGKPKATTRTYESIHLSWDQPSKGQSMVKTYFINVHIGKENGEPKGCKEEICKIDSISTKETNFNVTGLKAQARYFFTVSAYTHLGETSVSVMSDEIITKGCAPGTYHVTKHKCKTCIPGTFMDKEGMNECYLCPSGTYNKMSGATKSTQCEPCPAGTYNSREGSQSQNDCIACDVGTFNSEAGANHKESCLKCPEGTFGNNQGLSICNECGRSSFNPKLGQKSCLKCPSGTYTEDTGAVSITECIGIDAITLAEKKIRDIKKKLGEGVDELNTARTVNDAKLNQAMLKLDGQKKGLKEQISSDIKAVVDDINLVHGCKWMRGEGSTLKQRIIIKNVYTREECIYRCLDLKRNNPYFSINGVTRKLSTKRCMCVEDLVKAESMRYEYCMI